MRRAHLAIAEARIDKLKKRIEDCRENKRKLSIFIENLRAKQAKEEISYEEYESLLKVKREGRNILDWFEYYDKYIEECEKQIKRNNRKSELIQNNRFV